MRHVGPLRQNTAALGFTAATMLCVGLTLLSTFPALAQLASPPAQPPAGGTANAEVAARVDGVPIFRREVERQVTRVLGEREVEPQARAALTAQALKQLVKQRLIVAYLERTRRGATADDVRLAVARLAKQLEAKGSSLEEHLAKSELTAEQLSREFAWRLGWKRFLERYLTDENLQRYFKRHRRTFDGTKLRVAQILIKRTATDGEARQRAEAIRKEIVAEKLTFEAAVEEYSEAPSKKQGGDVGWIERRRPMPEPFSAAAFALKKGEVSPVVVSPFGAHLIRCVDVKPGEQTWDDARDPVRQAVQQYLFDWAADQQRSHSKVEYPGDPANE